MRGQGVRRTFEHHGNQEKHDHRLQKQELMHRHHQPTSFMVDTSQILPSLQPVRGRIATPPRSLFPFGTTYHALSETSSMNGCHSGVPLEAPTLVQT